MSLSTSDVQVAGISSLLVDLRTGLKQVRATILEPAEQQSSMTPAEKQAAASMFAFHRDSRAAFVQLEVSATSACSEPAVMVKMTNLPAPPAPFPPPAPSLPRPHTQA